MKQGSVLGRAFKAAISYAAPGLCARPIPLDNVRDVFKVEDSDYRDSSVMTMAIHSYLGQIPSIRDPDWGRTRLLPADPDEKIRLPTGGENVEIGDLETIDIPSSDAILVNSRKITRWSMGLTIVIRPRISIENVYRHPIAFGLYGTYDKNENFSVKKILLPIFDENQKITDTRRLALGDGGIARALAYASLCVEQIRNGDDLTPYENMEKTGWFAAPDEGPSPPTGPA